ncbi:hypothetical protein DEH18_05805 [Streptomyces sp. NHF165]|uniref:glutamate ABC transporter substrate-binding protein n=1 Tax=Streptomyces TaxID=1883 RepID=UPI00132F4C37|nr:MULTISPECIES: glutamate ABC transporter substrate-binding protein [Streptomyces]QHF93467.1 hypothetical protein DEH18_05805 [Streptomyces sp. NHF165]
MTAAGHRPPEADERAGAPAPGARPRTGTRRRRRAVLGTAALAAAVAAAVVPASEARHGGTGAHEASGTAHAASARPAGARAAAPAQDFRPGAPEPEKCADGKSPDASLRADGGSGKTVRAIKKRGKLVVGVDQNSYLWGFRDPTDGSIQGFDIDLVKAIARDILGDDGPDKITYKTIPTNKRFEAIEHRDVDMVVRAVTITCERKRDVAFSTAYFEAGQQLLAPEDSEVKGFDSSMNGRRICYASGSMAETMMTSDRFRALGAKPVVVPNQLDCLVRLQLGEADAVVTDNALAAGQAAQDPSVELVGTPQTVEPYGVAMHPDADDLVRRVNKVLEDYRKDGWRESYKEWLADNMDTKDGKEPAPPKARYSD